MGRVVWSADPARPAVEEHVPTLARIHVIVGRAAISAVAIAALAPVWTPRLTPAIVVIAAIIALQVVINPALAIYVGSN